MAWQITGWAPPPGIKRPWIRLPIDTGGMGGKTWRGMAELACKEQIGFGEYYDRNPGVGAPVPGLGVVTPDHRKGWTC